MMPPYLLHCYVCGKELSEEPLDCIWYLPPEDPYQMRRICMSCWKKRHWPGHEEKKEIINKVAVL